MFFPVLLILASMWTSSDGALSCPTRGGKQCVFPFTTKGGEEVSDCQPYNGKFFCATSLTKDHKYASWDYCKKDECKDVVDNPASKSIFGCIACIVQYAAVCVSSCIPNPFNTACTQCVLQHGIECAVTCGFGNIKASEFGLDGVVDFQKEGDPQPVGVPACVQVSKFFNGRLIEGSTIQKNSAAMCGTHCADNFRTSATAWNWFNSNIKNGRNALTCICLETKSEAITRAFIDSGLGPANNQAECPPKTAVAGGKN